MTLARSEVVVDGEIGTYHVVSRCVRRAFLCGWDRLTRRNLDHRKEWIHKRLHVLADIFAVEVAGYSIMANHTHLIVRTRPDLAHSWDAETVAERWLTLFPKRRGEEQDKEAPVVKQTEVEALVANSEKLATCRERLGSLSWFMRCLNESIARRANREDNCTGRFWEGRFKCQRLLDDTAVLACMAYVDLNPIRANVAETPEESKHTSAHARIVSRQARKRIRTLKAKGKAGLTTRQRASLKTEQKRSKTDCWLLPLSAKAEPPLLDMTLDQYLELLDWTGRQIRAGQRGHIPPHLSPILTRLQIDVTRWVETVLSFGSLFCRVAGKLDAILEAARQAGRKWLKGMQASRTAFPTAMPT